MEIKDKRTDGPGKAPERGQETRAGLGDMASLERRWLAAVFLTASSKPALPSAAIKAVNRQRITNLNAH